MLKNKTKQTSQSKTETSSATADKAKAIPKKASVPTSHSTHHILISADGPVPESYVKVHPELKEYFGYCFYKAAVQLRYLLDQALAKHGMIAAQFGVLRILKTNGEQNQITLCECLSIDRASMVKLVDRLEESGLVERRACKQDRRAKIVRLTVKGLVKADAILSLARSVEDKMMNRLTKSEQATLRKIVPKLLNFSLV